MEDSRVRVLVPIDGPAESEHVLGALRPAARGLSLTLLHSTAAAGRAALRHRECVEAGFACRLRPAEAGLELALPAEAAGHDLVACSFGPWEQIACLSPVPFLYARPGGLGDWSRIVVPLDGFPTAERVLPLAARLAAAAGSTLHLLRIGLPLLPFDDHLGVIRLPAPDRSYLQSVAERLEKQGVRTVHVELAGSPAREIVRYAADAGAGLIAMTSEECADRSAPVSHSVAEQVLRDTACPVLVERAPRRVRETTRIRAAHAR